MKLLITCGTTPFPSLAREVYLNYRRDTVFNHVILQEVSDICLSEDNLSHVKLYSDQEAFFSDSDLVITHAGAGTVFFLLKNNIKFVIVPNLERVDKHQVELARYIEKNNFAEVCYDLSHLSSHVEKCLKSTYEIYTNTTFDSSFFYDNFFEC